MKTVQFEKAGKLVEVTVSGAWAYAKCEGNEVEVYPQEIQGRWCYMIPTEEKEFRAMFGHRANNPLCFTHESAEQMHEEILNFRVKTEVKAKEKNEAEKEAIRNGEKEIELRLVEGEIVTGYVTTELAETFLLELGVAEEVNGWGTKVNNDVVEALGTSFTYAQVKEYTEQKNAYKEAKKEEAREEKAQEEKKKFTEAKETDKPILLRRYNAPCTDLEEECDMDIVEIYAMPDGTTKTVRKHTW